jgi:hypothetical protein
VPREHGLAPRIDLYLQHRLDARALEANLEAARAGK